MEGHDPYFSRSKADHVIDAAPHFIRGLIREGYRENAVGIHTADIDKIGDAVYKDAGLARTCPCENQNRSFRLEDCFLLFFI
jgi:hypothetical protein